jgi:uncharacterized protein YdeI (YjbR/CyaY-like superfamily)
MGTNPRGGVDRDHAAGWEHLVSGERGPAGPADTRRGLPVLAFASQAAWREWLEAEHLSSKGLWVKIAKKGSGAETVSYAEALDVALCYGWIDGQKDAFDDRWWLQRFTPRGARSKWSKINCARATALIEAGEMQPAGLRQVDGAKADGRWEAAYDSPSNLTVPRDLADALEANPEARAFFATLDRTNRYAILYRLHDAKRPATRTQRIEKFVAMLGRGEKLYP